MSKTIASHPLGDRLPRNDILAMINTQAWTDEKFASDLATDHKSALRRFAADHGVSLDDLADIDARDLLENPLGDTPVATPIMADGPGQYPTVTADCLCWPSLTGGCSCTQTMFGTPCISCGSPTIPDMPTVP